MKKTPEMLTNIGCLIVSLVCAIPFIGAFIGVFLVAPSLIGHSLRSGKSLTFKVAFVVLLTSLFYIGVAVTLMIHGQYLTAFFASAFITFIGLKWVARLENTVLPQHVQPVV